MSSKRQKFALFKAARRIWAISSIHGDARRLERLHQEIGPRFQEGDKLVYLGNMLGHGAMVRQTIDEILLFRREFLSLKNTFVDDVAYLRGSQEEMWQKLLQLQFATDPHGVLSWMLENGVAATLISYGADPDEGLREARTGPVQLTRWTSQVRKAIQSHPGHYELLGTLKRAAFSDDGNLLFVNAGVDPGRPLETQKDSFWWLSGLFKRIIEPYGGYRLVIRGFSPDHPGLDVGKFTATVDAGCGFKGPLLAACFATNGQGIDQIEI
ncbi:MAG: hypothetical protein R3245_07680 [Kiloniellales bacterium]|nr:hypothetical protein [Kiloniellales bacterium]